MSFIIRQISRTADGREIVRPTTVLGIELTVGRLTDNDVHLPDLAVEPRHAVIREEAPGQVVIESISGLGFGLDGRTVMRADARAATGAELRFGSHLLRIGAEDGAVTVTVERVAALSDASEAKDQQTVFTLRGLMPGKRISAYAFIALVLAAFLAWPVYTYATYRGEKIRPEGFHADTSWSSGKLSKAHAELANDCQACHTDAFVAVRDTACVACHTGSHGGEAAGLQRVALTGPGKPGPAAYNHAPLDKMLASRGESGIGGQIKSFFKTTFNVPEGRCVDCHTEHEGAGSMPATQQAFCSDCHSGLQDRLRAAGFKSGVGDASDFGLKHPQFRPVVLAGYTGAVPFEQRDARAGGNPLLGWKTQRAVLDRPLKMDGGLKFTHAQHISTSNGVAQMWRQVSPGRGAGMDCQACHKTDPSGTRYQPVRMETACQACHSLGVQTVGGTVRQLPHGQPTQVIADIRAFYGSGGGFRPAGLPVARYTRARPGDANAERRSADLARAAARMPAQASAMVRATFAPGGVCGECHAVSFTGGDNVRIAPVAQPVRFLHKGWFDHRSHENLAVRGPNGSRTWGCKDCHAADKSNDARDLLLPALANCQSCHTGENGATNVRLVRSGTPSGCAMCHDYHADQGAPWVLRGKGRKAAPANQTAMLEVRWR
jgi:pSer/pThr/pTyr-binding forkhead associated (FHA) protein